MSDLFNSIMQPLEWVVAWIMVSWHTLLTSAGMDPASGWTWTLSIVGLVIVIRIILIPLFVRQINASRALQLMQPEMRKVQEKYKGKTDQASREAMSKEMFALYREHKANPLSSCMPILLQSPIFFALFRVLNGIVKEQTVGPLNKELVHQAKEATIFGARISDKFIGAENLSTQILAIVLIILMSLTTFTTSRQLMTKNMPKSAMEGQFAQQQKLMMYLLPVVFAVSGVNFPIGVLIYWTTTNVWSMCQQFYVIRRMPAPGSPAEKAMLERKSRRGKSEPSQNGAAGDGSTMTAVETAAPVRNQPKKQPKSKRTGANKSSAAQPKEPNKAGSGGKAEQNGGSPDKGEPELGPSKQLGGKKAPSAMPSSDGGGGEQSKVGEE